jgi:hypothetical protein
MIQVFHPGSGTGSVLRIHEILERIRMRIREAKKHTVCPYGSRCGSVTLIRILIFYPSRIPYPGVKKGTGSRIRNTPVRWCNLSLDLCEEGAGSGEQEPVGLEVSRLCSQEHVTVFHILSCTAKKTSSQHEIREKIYIKKQCCGSESGSGISQNHMLSGLLDPDPDSLVRGMDPEPEPALDPDPSIIKQK